MHKQPEARSCVTGRAGCRPRRWDGYLNRNLLMSVESFAGGAADHDPEVAARWAEDVCVTSRDRSSPSFLGAKPCGLTAPDRYRPYGRVRNVRTRHERSVMTDLSPPGHQPALFVLPGGRELYRVIDATGIVRLTTPGVGIAFTVATRLAAAAGCVRSPRSGDTALRTAADGEVTSETLRPWIDTIRRARQGDTTP